MITMLSQSLEWSTVSMANAYISFLPDRNWSHLEITCKSDSVPTALGGAILLTPGRKGITRRTAYESMREYDAAKNYVEEQCPINLANHMT